MPPRLDDLLSLDHPVFFVAAFVDALDEAAWSELGVEPRGDELGAPSYHPRLLLSVWLYGFMTGVRSCRKLETACREQLPYLWLCGMQTPDHNTLWRSYQEHRTAMRQLLTSGAELPARLPQELRRQERLRDKVRWWWIDETKAPLRKA